MVKKLVVRQGMSGYDRFTPSSKVTSENSLSSFYNHWMNLPRGNTRWLITRGSDYEAYTYVAKYYYIGETKASWGYKIQPAVYLDSKVKIVAGSGTYSAPYILKK